MNSYVCSTNLFFFFLGSQNLNACISNRTHVLPFSTTPKCPTHPTPTTSTLPPHTSNLNQPKVATPVNPHQPPKVANGPTRPPATNQPRNRKVEKKRRKISRREKVAGRGKMRRRCVKRRTRRRRAPGKCTQPPSPPTHPYLQKKTVPIRPPRALQQRRLQRNTSMSPPLFFNRSIFFLVGKPSICWPRVGWLLLHLSCALRHQHPCQQRQKHHPE
jgi:hypothetical protein